MGQRFSGPLCIGLLLGALLACGRNPHHEPQGETITVSAAVATPPPPASSVPVEPTLGEDYASSSAAVFDGDRLVACADVVMSKNPFDRLVAYMRDAGTLDGGTSTQFLVDDDVQGYFAGHDALMGRVLNDVFGKGTATGLRPKGKPTAIAKPCRQQFSSRTIVASCAISAREVWDGGLTWQLGAEFIYFDALGDDRAMKSCLAAKGNWEELPKNSAEFLHEKHDQMFRRLLKDSE
jgi:hypothetical protein